MKKFFVMQKDATQCGVACVAMICRYYGCAKGIDDIERICPACRDGVSMLALSETASALGLDNAAAKMSVAKLSEIPLPCILHWNQNHFVVLYKVSKNGRYFYVADPGKGCVRYSAEEFAACWADKSNGKGIVMMLKPTGNFSKRTVREQPKKRTLRFVMGYMTKYKHHFVLVLLGMFVGSLLQLMMPFLTQAIVDAGIKKNDISIIWLILLGELMIVFGRTATDFIRRWLLLHISMRVNISLVSDFFIKLLKLPMAFFDRKLTGDLIQRIADHARVQTFLTSQSLGVSFSILNFIVFGIVLALYNNRIFYVFLAGCFVYGLWIVFFLRRRKILDYELFNKQSANQNKTYQFLTSMQEIKLQDCERRRRWEWEDVQADLFAVQMKILKLEQSEEAGAIFINEIKNIIVTVLAATAVIEGQITLGAMLAIQYVIGQLNSPVEQLMHFVYSLQDVRLSLERINEVHLSREEESSDVDLQTFESNEKSLIVQDVCFKYDPHALKYTLKDVSLTIPMGKVTAIVGASGSGKSTLIKLLLGYYTIAEGRILIGERDLHDYNLKWWRGNCGVVMQDGVIFSESIARNIAVSDDDIDEERMYEAARIANIHDFIAGLPLGYETMVGSEGVGLSQGQKQRILIARAVYKKPDFIFLDEATNSLDAKNERCIVDNLATFYHGRTVVVVAHRLSTVRNADNIVVLDGGRVVESGNHESLIDKHGAYYNLIKNQLELGD